MLEVEIARILHVAGEYIVVAMVLMAVWMLSAACEGRKWKKRVLEFADKEAQEEIERQKTIVSEQGRLIKMLEDKEQRNREAIRAAGIMAVKTKEILDG